MNNYSYACKDCSYATPDEEKARDHARDERHTVEGFEIKNGSSKKPLRKCYVCGREATTKEDLELFRKHSYSRHFRQNICKKCYKTKYMIPWLKKRGFNSLQEYNEFQRKNKRVEALLKINSGEKT